MGDKVYILTRHLLHSQTMDRKKQINKSNQDVHVWRMNDDGDDGDNNCGSLILLLLFEGIHTFLAF